MHTKKIISAILFGLAVIGLPLMTQAQTASEQPDTTGGIYGRVKNSVTGQYLGNARVVVANTDIVAFTDEAGSYRLVRVPEGMQTIVVSYTGLDDQRIEVDVTANGRVECNAELYSVARYGDRDLVELDVFTVKADQELNAQTVATNEQRYSANLKNVLSTEEFGGMVGNSVGEFMKFIPGLSVGYSGNEITEFAVRGIAGEMTSVTQDGAPMVFGSYTRSSRVFNPYTSDINNTSRIEVNKVPTPSSPADSIGGSINMVSKSVFDNDKPIGRISVGLNANSRYMEKLGKTTTSRGDKEDYKVQPALSFDYSLPVNKNFGIFVSGLYFPRAGNNENYRTAYETGGTGTGASQSSPYLQSLFEMDDPRIFIKKNLSAKADWRVTPNSVLSFGAALGENKTLIGDSVREAAVGTVGPPVPATGVALDYGPTHSHGATGRGSVQLRSMFQEFNGASELFNLNYRFDDGRWRVTATASQSDSFMEKDNPGGPFSSLIVQTRMPVRVSIDGAGYGKRPDSLVVYDNSNAEVDIGDISNYRVVSGQEIFYHNTAKARNFDLRVKRRLEVFPFPAAIEAGASRILKEYSNRGWVKNLTYNGPDGIANTVDPIPTSFLMQTYRNHSTFTGGGQIPFLSPDRVWEEWLKFPALFSQTAAQVYQQENNRRNTSGDIEEENTAYYLQAEARLLNGRLNILTGVRYERTVDDGLGPLFDPNAVWERNPDGSFARTPAGARIRKPEAGATNSIEQLNLTTIELGAQGHGSYDGYYPSLHLTYNVTNEFLVRLAYAKSFGRPDFLEILPGTTINEDNVSTNPGGTSGSISVRNPGLEPWLADNYDLSLEYYTQSGGIFSVGVFLKDIKDFFGTEERIATQEDLDALGLGPEYLGWRLTSTFNSGDAKVSGFELNARQSLVGLGEWGNHFNVFANVTKLRLEGNRQADFSSFVPETASWGVSFANKKVYSALKWNYRGQSYRSANATFGPEGKTYFDESLTMDLDLNYTISKHYRITLNVTNLTNASRTTWVAYGPETPDYAKGWIKFNTGAQYSLALQGKF
ncbi:MAG: TonB-dependent receptor [Opitutaceae bacterium]|nr:TonB-dependent receptor [Opitutaceae bacterium]